MLRLSTISAWLALSLNGAAIVLITLYPFDFQHLDRLATPFFFFERYSATDLLEPAANVLLFLPLGFVIARLWTGPRAARTGAIALALLLSAGLSLSIEVLQVALPSRHASYRDVVMNSLGGFSGGLTFRIWALQTRRAQARLSHRRLLGTSALYYMTVCLLILWLGRPATLWNLHTWDPTYPLLVGNEATGDRPWAGTVHDLILAPTAIPVEEANQLLAVLHDSSHHHPSLPLLDQHTWYPFSGPGPYQDRSGRLPPLQWQPSPPSDPDQAAAQVSAAHWLRSATPPSAFSEQVRTRSAFTIGVRIATAALTQQGPARMVSISAGPDRRNLTLGQSGRDLHIRLRTPLNGPNGSLLEWAIPAFFRDTTDRTLVLTFDGQALRAYQADQPTVLTVPLTPELTTGQGLLFLFGLDMPTMDLSHPSYLHGDLVLFLGVFIPLGILLALWWQVAPRAIRRRWYGLGLLAVPGPLFGALLLTGTYTVELSDVMLSVLGLVLGLLLGLPLSRIMPAGSQEAPSSAQ